MENLYENACCVLFTAVSCAGFIGVAQATDDPSLAEAPYHYGMPLHVTKVVSLTEPPTVECEVVLAHMRYIDSAGRPAEISYRKLSEACRLQN
ncbi:DUF2790 domain-containing protein [Pseudomonas sp. PB3P13]